MLFVRQNISLPLPYDARFTYNGLGKRDAGCIEHMTAYDKQLTDFTTIFQTKEYSSSWEQHEEALPHHQSLFIGGRVIAMIRNLHCVLNTTTRNNIVPVEPYLHFIILLFNDTWNSWNQMSSDFLYWQPKFKVQMIVILHLIPIIRR